MNLILDFGNTKIKAAVFEDNTLLSKAKFDYDTWKNEVKNILNKNSKIQNIVVSSVSKVDKEDFDFITNSIQLFYVNHHCRFPFQNDYETPQTLGVDRLVLASGAVLSFPNQNRLIIDAGTCITYDFVNENDHYLGGAIAPGIHLRYQSLHHYTAKLPLLEKEDNFDKLIGTSTVNSIHSGILNGITNEIEGFINVYSEKYKNFIIILTGGDAEFLAKRLKNTIFANTNFLLESLNQTFQYNQHD